MAKSTISVDVTANTNKATTSIKKLKSQLESTKGGLNLDSSLGNLGNLNKMIPGLSSIQGSLGGVGEIIGSIGAGAGALGAVGAAIGVVGNAFNETVKRGTEARKEFEKITVSLQNIDRNIGGAGRNMDDFTKSLEFISANGVNDLQDLGDAAKTLMIAFGGSKTKTMDLIKAFDDLAAGTGVNVSEWASMAAEVNLTGVSIKDLTKLSNRGIPIYQALGKAMGVTAEEAESMAKKGLVGTQEWTNGVLILADSFKGLSKEMSSLTLEGVEKSFEAMKKLRDESAGEGYSASRRKYLGAKADEMQAEANNPAMQAELYRMGEIKGNIDNFVDELSTAGDKLIVFGDTILGWLQGKSIATQLEENSEEYRHAMARNDKLSVDKAYKNRETLTSGQIKDIIDTISSDKWGAFSTDDGKLTEDYLGKRETLRQLYDEALAREEADRKAAARDAERDRKEAMTLKYSTSLEDKVSAVSGHHGIGIIGPENLGSEVERIKQGLMDGTIEDVAQAEKNLSILQPLLREYNQQLENEAKNKEMLVKEQQKKEADTLDAKIEEDKAYIEGKAKIGEQINDAQKDYDTVTGKLEEMQATRQQIADEEAHGIYRKKWGNLNVSDVSTKEAELLKEQTEAKKKLIDLKEQYEKYDENWRKTRTNLDNFFTSVVAGNVVPVRGVAVAG